MGKYCNTPIPNTDILITYFIAWHENDINWDHFCHDWATKAKHMKNMFVSRVQKRVFKNANSEPNVKLNTSH